MLTLIKNRIFRTLTLCTIVFAIVLFFSKPILAVVKPTKEFYINDYANLLNDETKEYIMNANVSLNEQTGAQIVVVTVKSLDGKSIETYATELFREFGIGDKTKNNGLLLLLALDERKFRVEVGYGLEGCLPDAKTGRIQDEYIIPYLKENNWNDGIKNGFSAFLQEVANEYNINIEIEEPVKGVKVENSVSITKFLVFGFIIGTILRNIKNNESKISVVLKILMILILLFSISVSLAGMINNMGNFILGIIITAVGLISGILIGKYGRFIGIGPGGFYGRWFIWRFVRRIIWWIFRRWRFITVVVAVQEVFKK